MPMKSVAAIVLTAAFGTALLPPALAAKHAKATKMTGACVQQSGRCVSDCDQFNWCTMYTCVNSQSLPFWRCFQPSGALPRPTLLMNRLCLLAGLNVRWRRSL